MYHNKTPLYPFGFGLSYTTYEYSDFNLSSDKLGKDETIEASVTIKNTGDCQGAEIVQLYAHCNSEIERPKLQLVGFAKVELEPGEAKTVTIPLQHEQLSYFNTETQTFDVEEGSVELYAAASSADLRLHQTINTEGATVKLTYKSDINGVDKIFAGTRMDPNKLYNLQGIPVADATDIDLLPPGIYIQNAKKLIKK